MVFCNRCGHGNPEGSYFCSSCGAPLDKTVVEDPTTHTHPAVDAESGEHEIAFPLEDVPEGTAVLFVSRGPNAGSRYLVSSQITTVGRHPQSDVFLDDVTVSRRHAEVHRSGAGYSLADVGSLNGTYLNRQRIEEDSVLHDGDELQIGKFKLVFMARPPTSRD
ncbi:MAG: FHA domain-containing protein [Acidimicrobiales bacterium]